MGSNFSVLAHADDQCPVDHKNMNREELEGMMAQYKRIGQDKFAAVSAGSAEATDHGSKDEPAPETPYPTTDSESAEDSDQCPVDHKNMSKEQIAAYMSKKNENHAKDAKPSSTVYDVYGQQLDRANLMPSTPNQLPSPGQKQPLSTDRVKSSIPKAGEDGEETWTYPSPQMFYNSLKRKGKADGVQESDMDTVVHVHNNMNERTWKEVMNWEKRYHCHECENPKLKRFQGKPHDLSPAARFRTWFRGYPMPFDRHDWVLDRCGQGEARYIIDYYYRDGPDPIEIHVRPAIDSVSAALDRLRNGAIYIRSSITAASTTQSPADHGGLAHNWSAESVVSGESLDDKEFAFLSNLTQESIQEIAADVKQRCATIGEAFRKAGDDVLKMEQANVAVNYCMAQRICTPQATDFMKALESGGDESEAYGKMTSCLDRFHIMARRALLEASGLAQTGPEFPAGVTPSVASSATPAPASGVKNR